MRGNCNVKYCRKAYAMNVATPMKWYWRPLNKAIFWLADTPLLSGRLNGLLTLSLIHFARWVIVKPNEFPHLEARQPKGNYLVSQSKRMLM